MDGAGAGELLDVVVIAIAPGEPVGQEPRDRDPAFNIVLIDIEREAEQLLRLAGLVVVERLHRLARKLLGIARINGQARVSDIALQISRFVGVAGGHEGERRRRADIGFRRALDHLAGNGAVEGDSFAEITLQEAPAYPCIVGEGAALCVIEALLLALVERDFLFRPQVEPGIVGVFGDLEFAHRLLCDCYDWEC